MKIHAVCVVRDEADILGFTLDAAVRWADAIYVLDNGSMDGTWELLQDYARRYLKITIVGRTNATFRNSLRSDVANMFLDNARKGDWWCRLDADEIYVEDPRKFLSRISSRYQVVYAIYLNYFFTEIDLAEYERDPDLYLETWTPDRLRFYTTNYSDPRFVRHIPGVTWTDSWPEGIWDMRPATERILMRNYDYRSPPQIDRRIHIRTTCTEHASFRHEKKQHWAPVGLEKKHVVFPDVAGMEHSLWRSRVVRSTALLRDDGREPPRINRDLVNPIWIPLPRHLRFVRRIRRLWREFIPTFSEANTP
jgi:glycosyltransferase involved in cell wall biosynthesis